MRSSSTFGLLEPRDDASETSRGHPSSPRSAPRRSGDRRWLVWLPLGALAVLIVGAVTFDVSTVSIDHRLGASLRSTESATTRARAELTTTNARVSSASTVRDARRLETARAEDEIVSTEQSLKSASQTGVLQALDLATLHACLNGVSNAITDIGGSNLQGAVDAITAASSSCLTLDGSGGGLVYPFDFPDPFVMTVGNEYYAFGTNSAAGNIQILESNDLSQWTTVGDALPHVASWAQPGATWAPGVLPRGNSYVLYYSALDGTTGEQCISEAVASQPQGPYLDTSTSPLVCQLDLGGSMDPSPYVAPNGTPYLTWKSQGANGELPTLWAEQLAPSGTSMAPASTPSPLLTPDQSWQGGVIEGPDMFVSGQQYLLLYSGNDWQTSNYAIGLADCSGPLGPCTDADSQPILASDATMSGPGGPTVFADDQGQLWLAFAAWLPGKVGYPNSRALFLRRITVTGGQVTVGL